MLYIPGICSRPNIPPSPTSRQCARHHRATGDERLPDNCHHKGKDDVLRPTQLYDSSRSTMAFHNGVQPEPLADDVRNWCCAIITVVRVFAHRSFEFFSWCVPPAEGRRPLSGGMRPNTAGIRLNTAGIQLNTGEIRTSTYTGPKYVHGPKYGALRTGYPPYSKYDDTNARRHCYKSLADFSCYLKSSNEEILVTQMCNDGNGNQNYTNDFYPAGEMLAKMEGTVKEGVL
ncbi:hypothetical protein K438DRAFT_1946529 [Mycena galopus ATCC 62051]|nr:hypothetical protein K438DRAFT_1946529 [Mycena galopus ATCC 62051]